MKMRKLTALFVALILLAAMFAGGVLAEEAGELQGHIVILHTNDSHGRADTNLGFTRVAYARKTLEAAGATVFLLDAGDTLHGLPIATVTEGQSIVEIMELTGYDAMTPGNHDFNYGAARLKELAGQAKFGIISANVTDEAGEDFLPGSMIVEKGLVKLGVFGLSTPETAVKTAQENIEGLTFGDPIAAAKEQVAYLEEQGCTLIVALSHLGLSEGSEVTSRQVAEQVDGIDIIVDGHSHTVLEDGLWVEDTLIVSTGEYIENIGCVDIDAEGLTAATLLNAEDLGETDVDALVNTLIGSEMEELNELLGEVVGRTDVLLEGTRELVRTQETNLGDLTADAIRAETGADVAMINGGSIRESIPAGDITKGHLAAAFPFGNYVVTVEVTGELLLQALENGVSLYPAAEGRFPQVSGMTFKFDGEQPAGERVFDVMIGGEALDPEKTYVLATSDYMVGKNDGSPLGGSVITGEYDAVEEVLIGYISDLQETPSGEGRIFMETKPEK